MYSCSSNQIEESNSYTDDDTHEATTILPMDTNPTFSESVEIEMNDESDTILKSKYNLREVEMVVGTDDSVPEEEVLVPPDGGFGWVVVLGAAIVNAFMNGTLRSCGILLVDFKEDFEVSESQASWIPALNYWLCSSLAPFTNGLLVKFSHRKIAIAGASLASSGLILSYFATSLSFLCISYGLICGLGAGLAYPIGMLIVSQYFHNNKGLAYGICTTGSAFGSVFAPFLLRYLLNEYGHRATVVIMGVILFVFAFFGALLLDPVKRHMKILKRPIKNYKKYTNKRPQENNLETASFVPSTTLAQCHFQEIPGYLKNDGLCSGKSREDTSIASHWSSEHLGTNGQQLICSTSPKYDSKSWWSKLSKSDWKKSKKNEKEDASEELAKKKTFALRKHIDFSVLKNRMYLVILLSNSTIAISHTNFLIILPAYAKSLGLKDKASTFFSVVNGCDIIGRIAGSYLSDFQFFSRKCFCILGLLFSGLALVLLPKEDSLEFIIPVLSLFGLASGMYTGVTNVLLTDELGVGPFASAYSINLFIYGIFQLISPPSFGYLLGGQSSQREVILYLGIILILGASFWFATCFIQGRKVKTKNDKSGNLS